MKRKSLHLLSILCVALFLIIAVASGDDSKSNSQNETTQEEDTTATSSANWSYSEGQDKMSSTKQYFASTTSTNEVEFEFPYDGGSNFTLLIRNIGKGNDVLVSVSKGQFITSIMSSEYCRVKFDDGEAVNYTYNSPGDASTDCIFLDNPSSFLKKLKTATKVMIEAPFYDAGRQIMEFNVADLEWNK